ncbi:hypothetical protein [Kitasatospora indigofera]|uniref:hypothetical protein n=1 Tax=Kitasatospora indigofera TaxID=67307 RepID=UPI0033A0914D
MTTSMTLAEACRGRVKKAAWAWALSRIAVEPGVREIAGEAIELLETAGLHGHKYAVDAALAAVALRQRGDVTIFRSDEEDMRLLCGDRVVVRGIRQSARPGTRPGAPGRLRGSSQPHSSRPAVTEPQQ